MRFRIPEILFGALLTVAVFAMGFVIALSMPPPEQKIESSNKQKPIEESHERTAEQQIAYYTKWLAWFTGALVAVAGIQGYFLLRADKTARITADAAKQSADGLRDAERPHMVLSELKITGIRRPPDSQGRVRLSVSTRILNYGRSPAHIKSFINLVVVGTEIGSPPSMANLSPNAILSLLITGTEPSSRRKFLSQQRMPRRLSAVKRPFGITFGLNTKTLSEGPT
jgi:hypothetical protein